MVKNLKWVKLHNIQIKSNYVEVDIVSFMIKLKLHWQFLVFWRQLSRYTIKHLRSFIITLTNCSRRPENWKVKKRLHIFASVRVYVIPWVRECTWGCELKNSIFRIFWFDIRKKSIFFNAIFPLWKHFKNQVREWDCILTAYVIFFIVNAISRAYNLSTATEKTVFNFFFHA